MTAGTDAAGGGHPGGRGAGSGSAPGGGTGGAGNGSGGGPAGTRLRREVLIVLPGLLLAIILAMLDQLVVSTALPRTRHRSMASSATSTAASGC